MKRWLLIFLIIFTLVLMISSCMSSSGNTEKVHIKVRVLLPKSVRSDIPFQDYVQTIKLTVKNNSGETVHSAVTSNTTDPTFDFDMEVGNYMFEIKGYHGETVVLAGSKTQEITSGNNSVSVQTTFVNGTLRVEVDIDDEIWDKYTIQSATLTYKRDVEENPEHVQSLSFNSTTLTLDRDSTPSIWNVTFEMKLHSDQASPMDTTLTKSVSVEVPPAGVKTVLFNVWFENSPQVAAVISQVDLPYVKPVGNLYAMRTDNKLTISWNYDQTADFYIYKQVDDHYYELVATTDQNNYTIQNLTFDEYENMLGIAVNVYLNGKESGFSVLPKASFSESVPSISWNKLLGGNSNDEGNSVIQTSDGGYLVVGYTRSNNGNVSGNHGGSDMWVVKLNSSGEIVWQKVLGGSSDDQANSVIQTSDGGYMVVGYTWSNDGDVSGNHGGKDMWVVKLSSSGEIDWQKVLGGSSGDQANSVVQTSDGGYLVVGLTNSSDTGDVGTNHGNNDIWIVKLNSSGEIDWQKVLGGSENDEGNDIIQTSDGEYLVVGYSNSDDGDVGENYGHEDVWIIKLNSNGEITWKKVLGGSSDDQANSVVQTNDGGYLIAGYKLPIGGGPKNIMMIKLNKDGNELWEKSFDLYGKNDEIKDVAQTKDGNYVLVGYTERDRGDGFIDKNVMLIKTDENGRIIWEGERGGNNWEEAHGIGQTDDGGFVVTGYTNSNNDGDVGQNHGSRDMWVLKFNW